MTPCELVWHWKDSSDQAQILQDNGGWLVKGRHLSKTYSLLCQNDFTTNWVRITGVGIYKYDLFRKENGWYFNGEEFVENSRNAIDPDIFCTALTNTIPIRRLGLADGESREIDVLFLSPPEPPKIVQQRYTRYGAEYVYEGLTSGFSAVLSVNKQGIVTHYPGVCNLEISA